MSSHSRVPLTVGAVALGVGLQVLMSPSLSAQVTDRDLEAIASWVAVDAATGYERRVAPALAAALGGWIADALGQRRHDGRHGLAASRRRVRARSSQLCRLADQGRWLLCGSIGSAAEPDIRCGTSSSRRSRYAC